MKFLEQDLEDIIWSALIKGDTEALEDRGFPVFNKGPFFRQYDFGEGYGISDIIQIEVKKDRDGYRPFIKVRATIYELKKGTITKEAFFQSIRYARAIKALVSFFYEITDSFIESELDIVLIGESLEKTNTPFLADVFDNVHLYTYEYDAFMGVTFKQHYGYAPTNLKNHPYPNKIPSTDLIKRVLKHCLKDDVEESYHIRKFNSENKEK